MEWQQYQGVAPPDGMDSAETAQAPASDRFFVYPDKGRQQIVRVQVEDEGTVALPMSRYDTADYLAIAVETVSRSLTTLRRERVITFFDARHFRIINRRAPEAHRCR
jgi:CRP-like cAMP-binding protein